jgi:hypothetical protein
LSCDQPGRGKIHPVRPSHQHAHVTHLTVAPLELDYLEVLCPHPPCPCHHFDISRSRPLVMAKFSIRCQLGRSFPQAGLNTEVSDPNLSRGRPDSPDLIIGRPSTALPGSNCIVIPRRLEGDFLTFSFFHIFILAGPNHHHHL